MKKCPYCAEEIQEKAIKCKHCGEMISKTGPKTTRIANICPRCSKEHDDTWKVCLDCSVPLVKKEVCVARATEEGLICLKCGIINDKDAFRCKNENCLEMLSSKPEAGGTKLKCPRCGFSQTPGEFKDAYSDSTCCCLAFIMILPAILYYFFRQGKKICPKCKAVF